jgi:hypothetical protein
VTGCVVLLAALAAPSSDALLAEGDSRYALRAEGATDGVAHTVPIEAAIAAYRKALALAPGADAAVFKLMRALYFRAFFCGASRDEQKTLYDEAARLGSQELSRPHRTSEGKDSSL